MQEASDAQFYNKPSFRTTIRLGGEQIDVRPYYPATLSSFPRSADSSRLEQSFPSIALQPGPRIRRRRCNAHRALQYSILMSEQPGRSKWRRHGRDLVCCLNLCVVVTHYYPALRRITSS